MCSQLADCEMPTVQLFSLGDGSPIGNPSNVQIFGPLVLDVSGWECGRPQSLLRLVAGASSGHAEHERCLIWCGSTGSDPGTRLQIVYSQ